MKNLSRSRVEKRRYCICLLRALPAGFWMVDWAAMKDAEEGDGCE